jgi:hypothetical protein
MLVTWDVELEWKAGHRKQRDFCRETVAQRRSSLALGEMAEAERGRMAHDLRMSSHRAVARQSTWLEGFASGSFARVFLSVTVQKWVGLVSGVVGKLSKLVQGTREETVGTKAASEGGRAV